MLRKKETALTPVSPTESDRVERRGVMAALDHAHALVWFDAEGRIVDANANALRLLAYSSTEIERRGFGDLIGDASAHDAARRKTWERICNGSIRQEERTIHSGENCELWCSVTYAAIRSDRGTVRRVLAIIIDLAPWSWRPPRPRRHDM